MCLRLGNIVLANAVIGLHAFVLMLMMTKVRCRLLFVLAIRRRYRPGKLDRHQYQQENDKEFFHDGNNSIDNASTILRSLNTSAKFDIVTLALPSIRFAPD